MGEINQARAYGVQVLPTIGAGVADYWKVVEVRHLSPTENRGRHNVFVDAVDGKGQRVADRNLRIGWTWAGRRADEPADPKSLDKGPSEPMGNVDLYHGAHVRVWMIGQGLSSEAVDNLHTEHADEPGPNGELWNTVGHHSFYVRFQRTAAGVVQPPIEPPIDLGQGDDLARLRAEVKALQIWQGTVVKFMQQMIGEM